MALTDNLISFWELEEASGTREDAHGANDLTEVGAVANAAGKVGNAVDFEFTDSLYLSRSDNADLSVGDIDFTWACWVNAESFQAAADQYIFIKGNEGTIEYYLRVSGSGIEVKFGVYGSSGFGNQGAAGINAFLSTGTWYFIVGWHDATADTVNIQINNGTPTSVAHSAGAHDGAATFYLGDYATGGTRNWDGLVDQLAFWKRVLTSDERTTLYNSGAGMAYADIAGGGGFIPFPNPRGVSGGLHRLDGGISE